MQELHATWQPDAFKLYPGDRQSHANCTRLAASHMQIPTDFIQVKRDCSHAGTIASN